VLNADINRDYLDYLSVRRRERTQHMSESVTAFYDEDTLSFEVPDLALELAGSKLWEGPASCATISFCSGLDSCPSHPR
jgi:hypothetical protein